MATDPISYYLTTGDPDYTDPYNLPSFPSAGAGQTYDAFGNVVAAGSPAASSADPTGLAQTQLDINTAQNQGNWLDAVKGLFTGSTGGTLGQLAAFGGLATLLNKLAGSTSQQPVGYQGGIPKYTFSRQQTAYPTGQTNELLRLKQAAQDAMSTGATQDQVREAALRTYGISGPQFDQAMQTQGAYRRPGQGGIAYFTGGQYTPTGADLTAGQASAPFYGGQAGVSEGGISTLPAGPTMRPLSAPRTQTTQAAQPSAPTAQPTAATAAPRGKLAPALFTESLLKPQAETMKSSDPGFKDLFSPEIQNAIDTLGADKAISNYAAKYGMTPDEFIQYHQTIASKQVSSPKESTRFGGVVDQYVNSLIKDAYAGNQRQSPIGGTVSPYNLAPVIGALDAAPEVTKTLNSIYGAVPSLAKSVPIESLDMGRVIDYAKSGTMNPVDAFIWNYQNYLSKDQIAQLKDFASGQGMKNNPTVGVVPGAASGGYMPSGIAMLAGGGQGGRYLRGPGDGVSDSIPAKFERSGQPARLADGEFVIDARTVSEIGNGSSEAGARKLYAMMDRVHKARKTAKRGEPSGADKYLPK